MIPESPIKSIETEIIPQYKDFDKAHNLLYVKTVIEKSLALVKERFEVDEHLVSVTVTYHNTRLYHNRTNHHLVSGEILMADNTLHQQKKLLLSNLKVY